MPTAARRLHARLGDELELQTADELAASVVLNQPEQDYQANRRRTTERLRAARVEADEARHSRLYGTGAALDAAVARVLRDAGLDVVSLDAELGRPASADLLVTLGVRRQFVEIKSASGNPSEALVVATARKHLATWPELRPSASVDGITLVVNHRANTYPLGRPSHAYERAEFVQTLGMPVCTATQLLHAWRRRDYDAVHDMIFRHGTNTHAAIGEPLSTPTRGSHPRRGWFRRRRDDE